MTLRTLTCKSDIIGKKYKIIKISGCSKMEVLKRNSRRNAKKKCHDILSLYFKIDFNQNYYFKNQYYSNFYKYSFKYLFVHLVAPKIFQEASTLLRSY